jgi:benzylsuccinate CoA-transferase BbsF subunit
MPPFQNGVIHPENSALYSEWNTGKFGMTVDLRTERGRAIARDLIAWADVVIESYSPGLMQRWGMDYASLAADRPDLIMLSTSINGQTGPLSGLAGYGNIGAALSGFQAIVGWPDGSPIGPFGPYTDYVGPRFSIATLLAAIDRRRRTGLGLHIDVAQVEAGVWLQAPELADNLAAGTVLERLGNADREFAPHGVFPSRPDPRTGAGRFVAIAVTTDEQWQALVTVLGRDDLAADPELRTPVGRLARSTELEAAVADWAALRTDAEAEAELQAAGVPAHRSADTTAFCTDPQIEHRGHLITVPHVRHGSTVVEGPRYLLSNCPARVDRGAPVFGQDNHLVLTEFLGYSAEQVDELDAAGVLR